MSAPAIGALRRRLTLEAPVEIPDEIGGVTRTFAALASLWASVAPVSGQRLFVARRLEEDISHLIKIRWRDGVTAAMRFRLGPRIFQIRALHDVSQTRRYLVLYCREIRP